MSVGKFAAPHTIRTTPWKFLRQQRGLYLSSRCCSRPFPHSSLTRVIFYVARKGEGGDTGEERRTGIPLTNANQSNAAAQRQTDDAAASSGAGMAGFCILSWSVACVCPSFRTACPLSECIHFYGMEVASYSKTHLIVEGCLDAIATEHSAATKSPSHLWALSLLRIKGRPRALQAASVESKISMSPSVVRRLFLRDDLRQSHLLMLCAPNRLAARAHCSPLTDNAYAAVVHRIRQFFTHLLYPFSWALQLPLGLLTTHKALRFGAKQ